MCGGQIRKMILSCNVAFAARLCGQTVTCTVAALSIAYSLEEILQVR